MTATRRFAGLFGLLFVAAATFVPLGKLGQAHGGLPSPWGSEVFWWALVLLVLLYVRLADGKPLSWIGFRRPRGWDIGLGLLGAVAVTAGMAAIYALVLPALHLKPTGASTMAGLATTPLLYRFLIVTRAAVAEEILFRGYGITQIKSLTGSSLIGAAVTLAAFTYAHLPGWGLTYLIPVAYAGAVLTGLYLWRRNIWCVMIAHWLTDAGGLILMPLLAAGHL